MDTIHYPLSTAAVLIPVLSGIAIILDLLSIIWHIRNRNIGASALIFWLIVLNLINFSNAIIWRRDNILHWWNGSIYCDIQVRLLIGATFGALPGALICIMKALARVLDTKRTVVSCGAVDRKRQCIMDCLLCFGLPVFFTVIAYVVQGARYWISGISGCDFAVDRSWPSLVLMIIWPPIMLLICSYYAGKFFLTTISSNHKLTRHQTALIIFRLYRYKSQVSGLLELNRTTRSRFLRLFIMCAIVIVFLLPSSFYQLEWFLTATTPPMHRYSWSYVHSDWNHIYMFPSYGSPVHWDRWMWISCGYIVFLCFGIGREARAMYRDWLLAIGLGRYFSYLEKMLSKPTSESKNSSTWYNSVSSKAKLVFVRKSLNEETTMTESM
jgi:pheromone a factor receptor